MRHKLNCLALVAVLGAALALSSSTHANTLITNFENFTSDALYPSWALPSATIVSGPTSYDITAIGYGSNYKYIGFPEIFGAGNLYLELTVTLEGPPEADGQLGPIVGLIDADGTHHNYAWYGQTLGSHVLTMPIASPTWVAAAGSTPGLDLNALEHMHMQLDPGGFGTTGEYTVKWENLRLVVPEPSAMLLLTSGCVLLLGVRRR